MRTRPEDLHLLGLDTKETISLGQGRRTWPLAAFCGPVFMSSRIAGREVPLRTHLMLPTDLLGLLYQRFALANPGGVIVAATNELDDLEFGPEIDEVERERLYKAGEVGWDVFEDRLPPHGRDPIRRYLPELFEPAVLQKILSDPTLDCAWRRPSQPEGNDFWSDQHHYRWSTWWQADRNRP